MPVGYEFRTLELFTEQKSLQSPHRPGHTSAILISCRIPDAGYMQDIWYSSSLILQNNVIICQSRVMVFVYSQCAVHIVVGPCTKGHFIHAGSSL
jgi:hypothetical protein